VLGYIHENRERLNEALRLPPYNYQVKPNITPKALLKEINGDVLRNLLFIFWIQDFKAAGKFERIDHRDWHCQNLLSAFFARELALRFMNQDAENIFLQSYLQDISLFVLSRTIPEMYDTLMDIDEKKKFNPEQEEKAIRTNHPELSTWILRQWGFPGEFIQPVSLHHSLNHLAGEDIAVSRTAKIINFSKIIASVILHPNNGVGYTTVKKQFDDYFHQDEDILPTLLTDFIRLMPALASISGFQEIADISVISLLKENKEFLKSRMLSYEELFAEILKMEKKTAALEDEIRSLSGRSTNLQLRDGLTALYTHTYLHEALAQEIRESSRYEYPVSFIILNIDDFSLFNKTYGYRTGDSILRKMADLITKNIRESDIVGRFGGDEFAIVLPHTGLPQGRFVAEKICRLIVGHSFQDARSNRAHKLSVSAGFTSLLPTVSIMQTERIIQMTRAALNKSKSLGGNTVTHAPF
ncbi:MAG: diguanylate cyclase, partial [Calditrichia bacterium]